MQPCIQSYTFARAPKISQSPITIGQLSIGLLSHHQQPRAEPRPGRWVCRFSWDDGLTHYIAINTNLPSNPALWVRQWEFVKADLARVRAADDRGDETFSRPHGGTRPLVDCTIRG